jgi:hypothetical protein
VLATDGGREGGGCPQVRGAAAVNDLDGDRAVCSIRPERWVNCSTLRDDSPGGSVAVAVLLQNRGIDDHAQRDLQHATAANAVGGLRLAAITARPAADRIGLRTS